MFLKVMQFARIFLKESKMVMAFVDETIPSQT